MANVRQTMSTSALAEARRRHADYIAGLILEMRKCLTWSEDARDKYYAVKDGYKSKGLKRGEIAVSMGTDFDAKCAVSDSQLYDRWATKYAAVVSAEIAAFEHDIHP